jgi:short-subunit dehydrogenase
MTSVLIIGATSAIASACGRIWAEQGCRLFLVGRDGHKLAAIAADLRVRGAASVDIYVLDVTETDCHTAMLDAAQAALVQIDTVLIAHGTLPDQAACAADPALALREFAINGTSAIALLTLIANRLERQGRGAIGVITSVAGDRGRPSNYLYGSAKAAVSAFCEGLRGRLFRHGVSLTEVRPGFVATPMTAGLALPPLLVAAPETVAQRIVRAVASGRSVVYAPGYWALIMAIIVSIPRPIFKRLSL